MYVVFTDDLFLRPVVEVEKILSFIGYKPDRPAIVQSVGEFITNLKKELYPTSSLSPFSPTSPSHLKPSKGIGFARASPDDIFMESIPDSIVLRSVSALKDELVISKSLTQWPCKSFRELDTTSVTTRLPLHSSQLAANCSAPYVVCSVRFDFNGG